MNTYDQDKIAQSYEQNYKGCPNKTYSTRGVDLSGELQSFKYEDIIEHTEDYIIFVDLKTKLDNQRYYTIYIVSGPIFDIGGLPDKLDGKYLATVYKTTKIITKRGKLKQQSWIKKLPRDLEWYFTYHRDRKY